MAKTTKMPKHTNTTEKPEPPSNAPSTSILFPADEDDTTVETLTIPHQLKRHRDVPADVSSNDDTTPTTHPAES